jgi:hypothetical protein
MPAVITIEDVTNTEGTGVFDKLMVAINSNITIQYTENRLTGSEYATVYLGSIQAAMAQAIQFVLQEQLSEAQIDTVVADIDVKERMTVSQLTTMDADVDTKERMTVVQIEAAYTDRVLKDKQAAKLGLDNVMKLSELSRAADGNFVYVPSYTIV